MEDPRKRELSREKKILEKYQELGNPARSVLVKIMNDNLPKRWSNLKKAPPSMNDKVLKEGIDQLLNFKIIVKRNGLYYLYEKHHWQLCLIARKQSDKINLDSYRPNETISENSSKSKTTIYGLKSDVFRAVVEGSRNTDINKKETLDFVRGIKASELLGKTYGTPLTIKNKIKNATEEEIVNGEVSYYLDLLKRGAKKENIIRAIITTHRNHKISFKEAGENFIHKLLELKKSHRYREMERDYDLLVKSEEGKIKKILKKFKGEFILIMNHDDSPLIKGEIEKSVFTWHGYARGLYSTSGALADKEKWKRNNQFSKAIDKLEKSEKQKVLNFLDKVVKNNLDLYPTHVSILCRVGSSDIMPLTEPKPPKYIKSSQKLSGSAT